MSKLKLPVLKASNYPKAQKFDEQIYARWSPAVKAQSDNEDTIQIYESIGEDWMGGGFTASKMAAALKAMGDKDVTVSINSPGGDFFEGATIYNQLREHKGHVTVKVPGLAASAASLIAMAGDTIQISEIGFIMIHNSWGIVMGNRNDMRKTADIFETFDNAAVDVYQARTGVDRDEIISMMDVDTWMNGNVAIDKGFADELMPGKVVDGEDKGAKSKTQARRSLEVAMARQGYSRKERDEIFQKAFGPRDAAEAPARDAGFESEAQELIKTIKEATNERSNFKRS